MFWHLLVPLVQHQFHLYYLLFGYLLIKPIEGNTSLNNLENFVNMVDYFSNLGILVMIVCLSANLLGALIKIS